MLDPAKLKSLNDRIWHARNDVDTLKTELEMTLLLKEEATGAAQKSARTMVKTLREKLLDSETQLADLIAVKGAFENRARMEATQADLAERSDDIDLLEREFKVLRQHTLKMDRIIKELGQQTEAMFNSANRLLPLANRAKCREMREISRMVIQGLPAVVGSHQPRNSTLGIKSEFHKDLSLADMTNAGDEALAILREELESAV